MAATATALSKRFEEWATDLTDKYRYDIFFRTLIHVIALQLGFIAFVVAVLAAVVERFEHRFAEGMAAGLSRIVEGGGISGAEVRRLAEASGSDYVVIFALLSTIAAVFGYLLSRVTLSPARNALSSQKQFIGNIAHELRTPLSVIKTNIEVALMDPALDPKLAKMLGSNIEELNRASDVINNLLSLNTFVRTEQIEFGNVDLGAVVDHAMRKLAALASGRGIEVTVRKSDYRIVWGNMTALEQVAMNLLKNAVNYTPPGGSIAIAVEPDYHGFMRLMVRDSGIGIAQKDLFKIFEPFYRADRSRTRGKGSSGLGLTIVSEIVKLHRGSVTIKSAVGAGTTAIVLLPCGRAAPGEGRERGGMPQGEISVDFSR